jgi:type IV pilus assembly protein PilV
MKITSMVFAMSSRRRSVSGFVLLDAVIAILIFSIGILGMVALQGSAVKLAGDAKYRTDAAMLTDQVIAQMWGSDLATDGAVAAAFNGSGGTGGPMYTAWAATLDCTSTTPTAPSTSCLPGVTANPPIISAVETKNPTTSANVVLVTVTVFWKAPNDTGPHNYVSITQLSR